MRERYYLWVVARLLAAVAIVAWAASYIGGGSGEQEFQKAQEAIQHVRTFRTESSQTSPAQHLDTLWEVDCNNSIVHYRWHVSFADGDPTKDILQDLTTVAGQSYNRKSDGTWVQARYSDPNQTPKAFCNQIAQGTDDAMFPQLFNMIRNGVIQKAEKKIVNGAPCREWHVTLRAGLNRLEHDSLCIGLEDHLPYEVSYAATGTHAVFSNYNMPIQIELPEAAIQAISTDTKP